MAGIPYYRITPCCPELGTQDSNFHIPDGPVPTGVYSFEGINTVINGISFQTDYCYTIELLGSNFSSLPDAPSFVEFSTIETDCNDPKCIACETALPNAFQVYACCDSATVVTLNIDSAVPETNGVYSYSGTIPFTVGGFTFEPGECYKIEYTGNSIEANGPSLLDFSFQGTSCTATENCPSCPAVEQYLAFTSCCDNTIVYLRPHSTSDYFEGVYEYLGTSVSGLENICYSLTIHDVGVAPIDDILEYGALPEAPAFVENVTFDTISDTSTNCADYILECPSCKKPCYTLYNCEGTFFNTTVDMSAYVGTFVSIYNSGGVIPGSWYVLVNSGNCNNAIEDIQVDDFAPIPCDCRCFEVTGFAKTITYINCDGELVKTAGAAKFCALTYPFVTGTPGQYQVVESGDCIEGECPITCYKLTNCTTSETIYSTTQTLSQYEINNKVVKLIGYDGCWSIDKSDLCTCPVNVTVQQAYNDCPSCLPIIAYKFTNCNNQALIKYSTEDYSAYVGKTVELECGECWFVTQIDFNPPSTDTLSILYTFDSCLACSRTYYKLTDCLNPNNVTYTYTDLSSIIPPPISCNDCINVSFTYEGVEYSFDLPKVGELNGKNRYLLIFDEEGYEIMSIRIYWNNIDNSWFLLINTLDYGGLTYSSNIDNECPFFTNWIFQGDDEILTDVVTTECTVLLPVIKIKGCDTCFTVEETREPINAGIVELVDSFIDCPECLETFPCVCNRITNQDTIAKDFTYIDCSFEEVTINLQPNETSDKVCLINWVLTPEEEALVYIEHFGDCINGQCPAEPLPKRKVKPGYSVPSCDIEKWEKITCKASEILYKEVMRLRYGISNCCPDEDEKWLIKKELIDLAALVDPDYVCSPVQSCGCPPSSCGCRCNTTLKTCNSQ